MVQAGKSFAVHVQHYQNHATDYRAPRAHSLQDLIRTFRCSYRHHSYAQLSHHTLRLLVQLPRRCISLHDSRQILSPAIGPSPRRNHRSPDTLARPQRVHEVESSVVRGGEGMENCLRGVQRGASIREPGWWERASRRGLTAAKLGWERG